MKRGNFDPVPSITGQHFQEISIYIVFTRNSYFVPYQRLAVTEVGMRLLQMTMGRGRGIQTPFITESSKCLCSVMYV